MPVWETPVTSITNGVHLRSWLNTDLPLLRRVPSAGLARAVRQSGNLGPDRRDTQPRVAGNPPAAQAPADRLRSRAGDCLRHGPQGPLSEVQRLGQILDPDTLTIVSRAGSPLQESHAAVSRRRPLKKILCDPQRPVQVVIAGNATTRIIRQDAHPGDCAALARPELSQRLVFVEEYGCS